LKIAQIDLENPRGNQQWQCRAVLECQAWDLELSAFF
jgi:hypothetical protein